MIFLRVQYVWCWLRILMMLVIIYVVMMNF